MCIRDSHTAGLHALQASSVSLYAMLRDARPSGLEDGRLTVTMPSDFALTRARDAVDADDVEMLQDLVVAATNEALRAAQDVASAKLGGATGGFDLPNIPGMF